MAHEPWFAARIPGVWAKPIESLSVTRAFYALVASLVKPVQP
jgi:hypothetical protein